jgi:two-component system cell cycle sensor histidine kinase/response regulator CckA
MIVEDNSVMRLLLAAGLVADNLEIVPAINGVDALELFRQHDGKFDAILTDNEMPKMEGLEFVRSVRKAGFRGRIVVMSGNMKPSKLRAFQEHNISDFLQKPFEVRQLRNALRPGSDLATPRSEISEGG